MKGLHMLRVFFFKYLVFRMSSQKRLHEIFSRIRHLFSKGYTNRLLILELNCPRGKQTNVQEKNLNENKSLMTMILFAVMRMSYVCHYQPLQILFLRIAHFKYTLINRAHQSMQLA